MDIATHSPSAAGTPANRMTRIRGWMLVVIGILLALGMAYAIISLMPSMTNPGAPIAGTTFTGTPAQARAALILLGAVALLGAAFTAGGVALLRRGRLGKPIVAVIFAAGGLLVFAVGFFNSVY